MEIYDPRRIRQPGQTEPLNKPVEATRDTPVTPEALVISKTVTLAVIGIDFAPQKTS